MYGLTTGADISLMVADMTVSGTVNGVTVSMIVDSSVTSGTIYGSSAYGTTNSF